MADIQYPICKRKPSGILKWYDSVHKFQQNKALDKAINIAIAGLLMVTSFTVAAQFIINRPTFTYNVTKECTTSIYTTHEHTKNRVLRNVKTALEEACDEYNDVNIGTQVLIDNTSVKLDIFYICEAKQHFVNAKVVRTGTNTGKCSESYNNVTKKKTRKFPVVVKDTYTNISRTFYTLRESCAVHGAIERLHCWW